VGEADVQITLSHPDLLEPVTESQNIYILGDWERSKSHASRVMDVQTVPYVSTLMSAVCFLIKPQILRRQLIHVNGKAVPILAGLFKPKGVQDVEPPRFKDSWDMKLGRLSALRTGPL
jgi:hypothetical protein